MSNISSLSEPDVALGSGSVSTAGTVRAHAVHRISAQRGAGLRAWRCERLLERVRAHTSAFALGAAAARRELAAAASHALDCTLAPCMAQALHASITSYSHEENLIYFLNFCKISSKFPKLPNFQIRENFQIRQISWAEDRFTTVNDIEWERGNAFGAIGHWQIDNGCIWECGRYRSLSGALK